MSDLRIIFMGTPEFAVSSLDILVQQGYDVVAVVTATDKYGGRGGKKLLQSAVKKYAIEHQIPVLQPRNLKAPEFAEELASFQADLQVVVAFRMLPEVVWAMPRLGTFNLHGSLLPKFRGAAPIHWAVIQGEKETGVTTFFIQHAIDTGDIILQKKMAIAPNETVGQVHDKMMVLGAEAVLETVQSIEDGTATTSVQDHTTATPAPKLRAENTRIDWTQSTDTIYNFIRGLNPYPTAWTSLGEDKWKILKVVKVDERMVEHEAGTLLIEDDKLLVASYDGYLQIMELQVPGKRRMHIGDFLNGWRQDSSQMLLFK